MRFDEIAEKLVRIPMFAHVDLAQIQMLVLASRDVQYGEGDYIFRQGERGENAFIILDGEVAISSTVNGKTVEIATIGENEMIGEMSLLCDTARTADVIAASPLVQTLEIEKADFLTMLTDFPAMGLKVTESICKRFIKTQEELLELRMSMNRE